MLELEGKFVVGTNVMIRRMEDREEVESCGWVLSGVRPRVRTDAEAVKACQECDMRAGTGDFLLPLLVLPKGTNPADARRMIGEYRLRWQHFGQLSWGGEWAIPANMKGMKDESS